MRLPSNLSIMQACPDRDPEIALKVRAVFVVGGTVVGLSLPKLLGTGELMKHGGAL